MPIPWLHQHLYTFNDMTLLTWFPEHGADQNKRCRIRDCTPLSCAVEAAPFGAIEILFRYGGSATHGQLLHYTAMRESTDSLAVLKYIYHKSPDVNVLNANKLLDQDSPEETLGCWIRIVGLGNLRRAGAGGPVFEGPQELLDAGPGTARIKYH